MKSLVLTAAAILACASSSVSASTATGIVSHFVQIGDEVVFEQSEERVGLPACSSPDAARRWVLSVSTPEGAALLDTLLTAEANRASVVLLGAGLCSQNLSIEKVTSLHLVP